MSKETTDPRTKANALSILGYKSEEEMAGMFSQLSGDVLERIWHGHITRQYPDTPTQTEAMRLLSRHINVTGLFLNVLMEK